LQEDNALDNRLDKILRIVEKCKYGVHDISRTELNPNGLPRFNMPFELGVFFAARRFGNQSQKGKNAIIFERTQFLYLQYLSDINGVDIKAHGNDKAAIIRELRNWLKTTSRRKTIPGPVELINDFTEFENNLSIIANNLGFDDVNTIPFNDYCTIAEEAIRDKLKNV
jgi:hypothetical protein